MAAVARVASFISAVAPQRRARRSAAEHRRCGADAAVAAREIASRTASAALPPPSWRARLVLQRERPWVHLLMLRPFAGRTTLLCKKQNAQALPRREAPADALRSSLAARAAKSFVYHAPAVM